MRKLEIDSLLAADGDDLLTTGEASRILGSSRQHVVDLCDRGDLPFTSIGQHRRIRRQDAEDLGARNERLTRDQRRSLWLGLALAGRLVFDPQGVMAKGQANLRKLTEVHSGQGADRWLDEWSGLLGGPTSGVLEALTSLSPRARGLRQNSPFAGVLSEQERQQVLAAFKAVETKSRS